MLKCCFNKPKFLKQMVPSSPPMFFFFFSLAEIMSGSKIYCHLTVKVYSSQDSGAGLTYSLTQLTPLVPTERPANQPRFTVICLLSGKAVSTKLRL